MSALVVMVAVTFLLILALAGYVVLRGLRARRSASRDRDLEETVLVYVLGGPAAPGPVTEREACGRSLNLVEFARVLAGPGGYAGVAEAESALNAARLRLEARGATTRLEPPDGSPPGSRPPDGLVVLTTRGAREALAVWARESARYRAAVEESAHA